MNSVNEKKMNDSKLIAKFSVTTTKKQTNKKDDLNFQSSCIELRQIV